MKGVAGRPPSTAKCMWLQQLVQVRHETGTTRGRSWGHPDRCEMPCAWRPATSHPGTGGPVGRRRTSMRPRFIVTLLGMLAIAGLSGCSNNPTSASLGTMNVQMTDAPGDFQKVNLVVNEVAVQHE